MAGARKTVSSKKHEYKDGVAVGYRFRSLPAYGGININHKSNITTPNDIYAYAVAFREVYEKSKLLSKKVSVPAGYPLPIEDWKFVYSVPQALVVQLALSNELLLKAVILGSTGNLERGHSVSGLLSKLDVRYRNYIEKHLSENGLKSGKWSDVIKASDQIFVTARYGYERGGYKVDFMTLQLINEALDDIFNTKLPDWITIKEIIDNRNTAVQAEIKEQVDLIFNEKYQQQLQKELEEFERIFNEED